MPYLSVGTSFTSSIVHMPPEAIRSARPAAWVAGPSSLGLLPGSLAFPAWARLEGPATQAAGGVERIVCAGTLRADLDPQPGVHRHLGSNIAHRWLALRTTTTLAHDAGAKGVERTSLAKMATDIVCVVMRPGTHTHNPLVDAITMTMLATACHAMPYHIHGECMDIIMAMR